MPGSSARSRPIQRSSRGDRPRLQPHAGRRPARLAPTSLLMAPGGGFSLPQLAGIPTAQRLIADDRLAVTLAESLVKLDIASPEDWKKGEHEPTSYIRITLDRWIDVQGRAAI